MEIPNSIKSFCFFKDILIETKNDMESASRRIKCYLSILANSFITLTYFPPSFHFLGIKWGQTPNIPIPIGTVHFNSAFTHRIQAGLYVNNNLYSRLNWHAIDLFMNQLNLKLNNKLLCYLNRK